MSLDIRDRIVEFTRIKASDLTPHPQNWRKHPKAQQDAMSGILKEVGYVDAIMVRKHEGGYQIIDGHLRAETTPNTNVPVLVVDLDDAETALVLATFDPLAAMAEASAEHLDALLQQVNTTDAALQAMLADVANNAGLYAQKNEQDAEPKLDQADELNKTWQVKTGDIWLVGQHRLMCGDSTKADDVARLMNGAKADLCFTSPPYALGNSIALSGNKSMSAKSSAYIDYQDNPDEWNSLMSGWFAASYSAVSKVWILNVQPLAGNKRNLIRFIADNADRLVDIATWDKGHAAPQMAAGVMTSSFEWMIIFGANDGASRAIPMSSWRGTVDNVYAGHGQHKNEFSEVHAATMPLHVPTWVMQTLCDQSRSVYEPFCGTGTTLIAAEQLNRKCYGMEISPAYCAVILQRATEAFPEMTITRE